MAIDPDLFFARRLGLGLRPGEQLPAKPREWALDQLRTIPPFGFLDASGKDVGPQALGKRTESFEEAARIFEKGYVPFTKLQKQSQTMSLEEFRQRQNDEFYTPYVKAPIWREFVASTLTAVNGNSPVFERFFMFWTNHFIVATECNFVSMYWEPHRQAIRARLTGKFADLLYDAVINPAMLAYLNNITSVGPHSLAAKDKSRENRDLNENLGRELLELYSLSPAAGYSQADVTETALALTGWTRLVGRAIGNDGGYGLAFSQGLHEPGPRTIMGKTYPPKGNGQKQIRDLIEDLAKHPATAQHLAFKLARAFVADDPPPDSVARIAKAYMDTGGDMIALHSATVEEVLAVGQQYQKMTTPQNWIAQAYRVTGVEVPRAPATLPDQESIGLVYKALGQPLADPKQPNGFPDTQADWISREMLDRRVRQAYNIGAKSGLTEQMISEYAARLAGDDSPLVTTISHAQSRPIAVAVLLASSQFLKI